MEGLRLLQVGLGPLGIKISEFISERNGVDTVAAVDKNPDLVSKSLSELSSRLPENVTITDNLEEAVRTHQPDAAIVTTVSDMKRLTPQIIELVNFGVPVVSTCEELSFPWETSYEDSKKIDDAARENGVAVVGTGVNPGFLMDALPTFLTSICQHVDSIIVKRYQNASFRRGPFQKKIGAGLTLEEFESRKAEGTLRHVGLTESMRFIGHSMGWKIDRTEDIISPVIAEERTESGNGYIEKGFALGVCQEGTAFVNNDPKIRLTFQAAIGEKESYDEIIVKGTPDVTSKIDGGVNGDIATCSIAINAVKSIINAKPGLRTMNDIPLVSHFEV